MLHPGKVHVPFQVMAMRFYRSGLTNLSDERLRVLDALSMGGHVGFVSLTDEGIRDFLGPEYRHGLADDLLQVLLREMVLEGLLRDQLSDDAAAELSRRFGGEPVYAITPDAAALWEVERQPIWSRYVTCDAEPPREAGEHLYHLRLYCVTKEVGEAYLESGIRHRVFRGRPGRFRRTGHREPCWKRHAVMWVVHVPDFNWLEGAPMTPMPRVPEEERSWWENLRELQKFIPARPPWETDGPEL